MNKPVFSIRKTPHKWKNEMVMGISLSRYGASWLHAGGDWTDRDGFVLWMMNIPFENENGEIVYISQDDAEDAYEMMSCGKLELEINIRKFLSEYWDTNKQEPKNSD